MILILLLSFNINASNIESFYGDASIGGKKIYREDHEVIFDEKGKALEAETKYIDVDGNQIATLKSNFRSSITLPEHTYKDLRTGNMYGVRLEGKKVVLFQQEKDKEEKTKILDKDFAKDRLQVGCQGLNYYFRDHLEEVVAKKTVPVVLMIPGNLDTYDFKLHFVKQNENIYEFEVYIENWFLRIFAPKLEFKYDSKLRQIVWYKGLSNVADKNGKPQNVLIDYKTEKKGDT